MNKPKHTPGPWKVSLEDYSENRAYIRSEEYDRDIACVLGYSSEQLKANAKLIAAAPDLLAACERALVAFENQPPNYNEDRYEPLLKLSAAIKKAGGR